MPVASPENDIYFSRQIPANLDAVRSLCQEFRCFLQSARLDEEILYVLQLTLEELASNVVKYGKPCSVKGWIRVTLQASPQEFSLIIEDNASAFDPLAAVPPNLELADCDRKPGGLGLHLVRCFADQIYYERVADTNRLVFVKKCGTPLTAND